MRSLRQPLSSVINPIGIHPQADSAIAEYIEQAEFSRGPFLHPRNGRRSSGRLIGLPNITMPLMLTRRRSRDEVRPV